MRFTSPALQGNGDVLYQCPVGLVLRDHPWAYAALEYVSYADNLTPEGHAQMSRFSQGVLRLRGSEMARLDRIEESRRRGIAASRAGLQERRNG
jgi:hypothetical protein